MRYCHPCRCASYETLRNDQRSQHVLQSLVRDFILSAQSLDAWNHMHFYMRQLDSLLKQCLLKVWTDVEHTCMQNMGQLQRAVLHNHIAGGE